MLGREFRALHGKRPPLELNCNRFHPCHQLFKTDNGGGKSDTRTDGLTTAIIWCVGLGFVLFVAVSALALPAAKPQRRRRAPVALAQVRGGTMIKTNSLHGHDCDNNVVGYQCKINHGNNHAACSVPVLFGWKQSRCMLSTSTFWF